MQTINYIKEQKDDDPINTFIIPFIRNDNIYRFVERLWLLHSPREHRLILIDNTGGDEVVKDLYDKCHLYIRSYRNLGIYKAYNIGWMAATTEYVTFVGDDTVLLHKNWFTRIKDLIEKNNLWGGCPHNLAKQPDFVCPKDPLSDEEFNSLTLRWGGGQAAIFHALVLKNKIHERVGYFPEPGYPGIYHDGKILRRWERELDTPIHIVSTSVVYHEPGGSQTEFGANHSNPTKIIETENVGQYTNHQKMHL